MSGRKKKPTPSSAAREAVAAEVAEMQRVAAAAFKRPDKETRAGARSIEGDSGSKYYAFALSTTTDASADRRAEMLNRLVGAVEADARAAEKVTS